MPRSLAVDELHGEIHASVIRVRSPVYPNDVLVIDRGCDLHLAAKPLKGLVVRELGPDELECDIPVQNEMPGAVHHAHPALAESLFDAMAVDHGPDPGVVHHRAA